MAISSPRDNNGKPMLLGSFNLDGKTVLPILVNPDNHAMKVDDNTTGSNHVVTTVQRDANRVPAIWGVSSADGKTPVYIAENGNGELLIDSN